MARFSEAFLLLKAQEAGFAAAWVPITMVVMHAVYGLTAYPVGALSDRLGRKGLLAASLGFLIVADLVIAQSTTIYPFLAGIVLWGLHMGFRRAFSQRSSPTRHQATSRVRPLACST